MEFNPLFLNINNQINSTGDIKLNRFGNLSYLFKDIIKVNMNSVSAGNEVDTLNSQNLIEQNLNNLGQISVSEDELKKVIETILAKLGNLSGNSLESNSTVKSVNEQSSLKNKKVKDTETNTAFVNVNGIINQLEAGKTIKLNFTDLDENYSIEISKNADEKNVSDNSNSLKVEIAKSPLDEIQAAKQSFTFKNPVETTSQGIILGEDSFTTSQVVNNSEPKSAFKTNIIKNTINEILLNENAVADNKELNIPGENIKTVSDKNVDTLKVNDGGAENLLKELKSLLENRASNSGFANNSNDGNYEIKIVKQEFSNNLNNSQNINVSNEEIVPTKPSGSIYKTDEKLFEVNQKISSEAQKDFKQLENQNHNLSKIKFSSSEEILQKPVENKITTENKLQNDKPDLNINKNDVKILNLANDEIKTSKTINSDSNSLKQDDNKSEQINVKENIQDRSVEKIKPQKLSESEINKDKVEFNNSSKDSKEKLSIKDYTSKDLSQSKNINKNEPVLKNALHESTKLNLDPNEKSLSKAVDSKEINDPSKGKLTKQSDVKIRADFNTNSSSFEMKEAKNENGLKTITDANNKEQFNSAEQNANQSQNQKDSKTSPEAINPSVKNDNKEAKTEFSNDKSDNPKLQESNFNSELKNAQNSEVKETRSAPLFHEQPKMIKPSQILHEISSFIQKGDVKSIVLKLTPENLGNVKVEVNMIDKALHANIEVDNESVKQTIQTNFDQLKSSLIQSGIAVAGLTISLNNSSEKNSKAFEAKKKTEHYTKEVKSDDNLTISIPKKMGYNTYEYLA